MRTKFKAGFGALAVLLMTVATVPLLSLGQAGATTTGGVTLAETVPASVLYGQDATVGLTATNHGAVPLYNMSVRDVLPAGVSYVAGSSTPADLGNPTVIDNEPAAGETTLIWPNVSDLQVNSPFTMSFKVTLVTTTTTATTDKVLPGYRFHDTPGVYLSSTPRTLPKFAATGKPTSGYTAHVDLTTTTTKRSILVSPLAITKTTPQPEKELERGVHDHPDVYTVKVRNNTVKATNHVTVEDWVPAGMEFLACGGVDHTTNAEGTYPGHTVEYPGAPRISTAVPGGLATCITPEYVDTVTATPPVATAPKAVYTLVKWTLGTFTPSQVKTFTYYGAVPLRANTLTWTAAGTAAMGTETTGIQTANLNNNNGPETLNDEALTNYVQAIGTYTGDLKPGTANPVGATNQDTVIAHDLAVQKTVSTATFTPGKIVSFTLHVETSEYRYSTGVHLTDVVPNGICPIDGTKNYDEHTTAQCDPVAAHTPVLVNNRTHATTPLPYTSVVEQPTGKFTITWSLGAQTINATLTVKFYAVDRSAYQKTATTLAPTLTGDSLTNHTTVKGLTHTTCYTTTTTPTPAPQCAAGGSKVIYAGEPGPTNAVNTSKAGQNAPQPTIVKRISEPVAVPTTMNCAKATYELTPTPPSVYQRGDLVCFQLQVQFPTGLHSRDPDVTDFLPPNTTFVSATAVPAHGTTTTTTTPTTSGTGNTVTIAATTTAHAATGEISWTLGTHDASTGYDYSQPGQKFLVDVGVIPTTTPTVGNTFDLTTNLMKFTSSNSTTVTTSLRSAATYKLSRPILVSLSKGVKQIKHGTTVVDSYTPPRQTAQVEDTDAVTYAINVSNEGLEEAYHVAVWDDLPSQISCADVPAGTISNGGTCAAGVIKWPGTAITVPAATNATPSVDGQGPELTYVVDIPAGIGSGVKMTNHTGVVSYLAKNNQGGTRTEYPATNIDTAIPHGTYNSPAANATASVTLAKAILTKTVTPTTVTLGQTTVKFTVTATLPAGTTLYTGKLTDPLDAHCPATTATTSPCLTYKAGSAKVTVTATTTPGTYPVSVAGNTVTVTFPAPLHVGATAMTVKLTVEATVKDVAGYSRGKSATNTATLSYDQTSTGTKTTVSHSAKATIVEPDIEVTKTDAKSHGPYTPGATVSYTITVGNCVTGGSSPFDCTAGHASKAYHVVLTDTLQNAAEKVKATSLHTGGTVATVGGTTVITWVLATLAAGAKKALTYTAVLPTPPLVGSSTFKNAVTVTTRSLTTGHATARTTGTGYQATATDTVFIGKPSLTKTATPGTVTNGKATTYTVTVDIPKTLTLPNFTLIDTLPDGMTFTQAGTSSCSGANCTKAVGGVAVSFIGHTPAGTGKTRLAWYLGTVQHAANTRTVTLHYTAYPSATYHTGAKVVTPKTFANSADVYWNTTSKTTLNPPTTVPTAADYKLSGTTVKATVKLVAPKLTLRKTVSTTTPTPGVNFSYTVTVTDATGATISAAYFPKVTDTLPKGLLFEGNTVAKRGATTLTPATTHSTNATGVTKVTWTFTTVSLAPGASLVVTFTAKLGPSATLTDTQVLQNVATVATYYGVPTVTATGPTKARYVAYTKVAGHKTVTAVFPKLKVVKTAPTGTAATVGTTFHWKLVVTDLTAAPASTVTVTDTLPAYWTYTAGQTTITLQGGGTVTGTAANPTTATTTATTHVETLVWKGAELGAITGTAKSVTIAYSTVPGTKTAHTVTNKAATTGQDGSGATGNKTGSYGTPTATAKAKVHLTNLTIKKTVGGTFVAGTDTNPFDVAVKNTGPDTVNGTVTVVDPAPTGTTIAKGSGTGWTCTLLTSAAKVSCTHAGPLADGDSEPQLVITVAIPAGYVTTHGKSITNAATVSSPTFDTTATNASSATGTVTTSADLAIVKVASGSFVAGDVGTYGITVTDLGPSDSPAPVAPAKPIQVKDTLPSSETYTSASGADWSCAAAGQTVTCTYSAGLLVGTANATHLTLKVKVKPTTAAGTISNTAAITQTTIPDPVTSNNHSTATKTVTTTADLSISKSHTAGDPFTPGTDVTYFLKVHNNGPSVAHQPKVVDTLPAMETFKSVTAPGWTCTNTGTANTVTCTATATLAPNATASTITLVVTLSTSFTGPVVNKAHVSSTTPDSTPHNNTAQDTGHTGTPDAVLKIVKTHTGSFVAGTTGTYTLTVTNKGPSQATKPIKVVDTLPAGETYTSATGTDWSCTVTGGDAQKVNCKNTTSLADGATTSFTLKVKVAATTPVGSITNRATATSTTPSTTLATSTATNPTTIITKAHLSLAKAVTGSTPLTPGTDGTYVLTVTNTGPSDARTVTVSDALPTGETFVSGGGSGISTDWSCTGSGTTANCSLSGLLGLTSTSVKIKVAVAADFTGTLHNVASVGSSTTNTNPTVTATNTKPVTPLATLTVTKTSASTFVAGRTATYHLVVKNTGPSANQGGFKVVDHLPTGETYTKTTPASPGWTCAATGQTVTCTSKATVVTTPAAVSPTITLMVQLAPTFTTATITNPATVTSNGTTFPKGHATTSYTATVATTADLSIVKSHTGDFTPGTDASYTLAVKNAGPSDAAGPVTVADPLPAGETYVSGTGTGWTCADASNTVTCTLAAGLAAGSTAKPITLTVKVGGAAYPTVANTATVHSATPDPTTKNNSSTDTATVKAVADLSIVKVHVGTPVAGENLTYQLTVANAGPTLDPGPVTVVDTLPTGETYVSATGTGWTCADAAQKVTCTWAPAYPVGQTSTVTLVVAMGAATVPTVANTATVSGTAIDPDTGNNSSTDTATVAGGAALTLTKTLTSGALTVGGAAIYKLTVANAGPSPATNVVITDTVPAGLQPTAAKGTGWTCQLTTPKLTCTYGSPLAAGSSASFTLTATVTASAGAAVANGASVATTTVLVSQTGTTASTPPATVGPAPSSGSSASSGGSSSGTHTTSTGSTGTGSTGTGTALAFTGFDLLLWLAAGLLLLLAGAVMWVLSRRAGGQEAKE